MTTGSGLARRLAAGMLFFSGVACAQMDAITIRAPVVRNPVNHEFRDDAQRQAGVIGPTTSARPGVFFFKKGVQAFKRDQVAFAIEMYETSAAYAYKPAQYNLSIIYAKGQGVPADMPRALAWVTLAAERGDKRYAAARNAIYAELSPQQVDEADRVLKSLIPKYADATAMKRAKSRWKDARLEATGSRLGFVGGLKVGAPGGALGTSQKTEVDATESAGVSTNAWEATGGKQVDGSIAYRQLRESDDPYDPKFGVRTGTVKVGEIDTIPESSTSTTEDAGKQ
jgi:TPR repeat protein